MGIIWGYNQQWMSQMAGAPQRGGGTGGWYTLAESGRKTQKLGDRTLWSVHSWKHFKFGVMQSATSSSASSYLLCRFEKKVLKKSAYMTHVFPVWFFGQKLNVSFWWYKSRLFPQILRTLRILKGPWQEHHHLLLLLHLGYGFQTAQLCTTKLIGRLNLFRL